MYIYVYIYTNILCIYTCLCIFFQRNIVLDKSCLVIFFASTMTSLRGSNANGFVQDIPVSFTRGRKNRDWSLSSARFLCFFQRFEIDDCRVQWQQCWTLARLMQSWQECSELSTRCWLDSQLKFSVFHPKIESDRILTLQKTEKLPAQTDRAEVETKNLVIDGTCGLWRNKHDIPVHVDTSRYILLTCLSSCCFLSSVFVSGKGRTLFWKNPKVVPNLIFCASKLEFAAIRGWRRITRHLFTIRRTNDSFWSTEFDLIGLDAAIGPKLGGKSSFSMTFRAFDNWFLRFLRSYHTNACHPARWRRTYTNLCLY